MDGYVQMKRRNIGGLLDYAYYMSKDNLTNYIRIKSMTHVTLTLNLFILSSILMFLT